ncbi:hypothetical protein D3C81_1530340 [compost metagenome]
MTSTTLAGWNVLRYAVHIHSHVRTVSTVRGEATHAEAIAGVPLIDVVCNHAWHTTVNVGDVPIHVERANFFLSDSRHCRRQALWCVANLVAFQWLYPSSASSLPRDLDCFKLGNLCGFHFNRAHRLKCTQPCQRRTSENPHSAALRTSIHKDNLIVML